MFATTLFSLIMVVAALPFKMTQASVSFGTARIDRLENVRIEFEQLLNDLRGGIDLSLSDETTLPSGSRAYRCVQLTDSLGRRVSYGWKPLDDSSANEFCLFRDLQLDGASLPGCPKTVVPRGVREFWLRPLPPLDQSLSEGTSARTVQAYLLVYPDDAPRPLGQGGAPSGGKAERAPLELGSGVTLRNDALR